MKSGRLRASLLASAGVLFVSSPSFAAVIDLNATGDILNPSFELSNSTYTDWTFLSGSSAGVYTPTSTNYNSASDGLGGGKLVPDGNNVAYIPAIGGDGSGTLLQTLNKNNITFAGGNTYKVEVWVAMPLVVATSNDGLANHSDYTVYSVSILQDNSGSGITGGLSSISNISDATISSLGQWALVTAQVTCAVGASCVGKSIDIELYAATTNGSIDQPHEVDFDIATATPLPGALPLFGGGLGVLGLLLRSKKRKGVVSA